MDNEDDNGAPSQVQVGSPVIASTVGGDNYSIDNLNEPIIVTLKVKKVRMQCYYWPLQWRH